MSIRIGKKVVALVGLALLMSTVSGAGAADAKTATHKTARHKTARHKTATRKTATRKTATHKTAQVYSTYDEPVPKSNGVSCPGISTAQPKCAIHDSGYAYFVGTFQGTAHYDLDSLIGLETKSRYEGDGNQFDDVIVDGCGHGTFHMDESDGYIDFGRYDPVTNSAPGYNRWRIRPDSGTGDLVGLAGEGENNWTFYLNGYLPTAGPREGGKGVFTGTVSCRGLTGPPASASASAQRKTSSDVSGGWVQAPCVPTSIDPLTDPKPLSVVCEMVYNGTWTGNVIEHINAVINADGSVTGTNDYVLTGRAEDNTCGTLTFHEDVTGGAAPNGTARGVGRIVSGTGDWAGSSGIALISGFVVGGAGVGGYSGTWTRPAVNVAERAAPCVPPLVSPTP